MISIKNLSKIYADGTSALRNISLSIKKGEFVSIMGPSGSGKSTLLHVMSFLDQPTSGSYVFQGRQTETLPETDLAHIRNEKIGFVFQSFNLLSRSSVYENVELPLLYSFKVIPEKRRQLIEAAVKEVGLKDKLFTAAGKLSGGEKQRVAIARALITAPNLIFADEPTGNLDSKSGAHIMEILDGLHKTGHTILLVTHETYTAAFAERIIELKDGEIISDKLTGSPRKEFFK